jgi:hypothetical protein
MPEVSVPLVKTIPLVYPSYHKQIKSHHTLRQYNRPLAHAHIAPERQHIVGYGDTHHRSICCLDTIKQQCRVLVHVMNYTMRVARCVIHTVKYHRRTRETHEHMVCRSHPRMICSQSNRQKHETRVNQKHLDSACLMFVIWFFWYFELNIFSGNGS